MYYVERLREGRSYCTRGVKAVQNGNIIFHSLCSFHLPEPWQPSHQWQAPVGVPALENCELEEDLFRRYAAQDGLDQRLKKYFLNFAAVGILTALGDLCVSCLQERANGPIAVRRAVYAVTDEQGVLTSMYWMQARTGRTDAYETPYQKVSVLHCQSVVV